MLGHIIRRHSGSVRGPQDPSCRARLDATSGVLQPSTRVSALIALTLTLGRWAHDELQAKTKTDSTIAEAALPVMLFRTPLAIPVLSLPWL